jgi:hypothetical protein
MKIEYFRHEDNDNILATMIVIQTGPDKGKYGLCFTKPRENGDKKMGRKSALERLLLGERWKVDSSFAEDTELPQLDIKSGTQLGKLLYKKLQEQRKRFLPLADITGGNLFVTIKQIKGIEINNSRKSVDFVPYGDNGNEIRHWIEAILALEMLEFKAEVKQLV